MSSFFIGVRRAAILAAILWLLAWSTFVATAAGTGPTPEIRVLDPLIGVPTAAEITGGSLDSHFTASSSREPAPRAKVVWLKIRSIAPFKANSLPVLVARTGWFHKIQIYPADNGRGADNRHGSPLPEAVQLPEFAGAQDIAFILPWGAAQAEPVYARIESSGHSSQGPRFSQSTLDEVLERGAARARMIALTFGALTAMAVVALLIWVVLAEKTFILYGTLFLLQALYVAYFSGQAFKWPLLSYAQPLGQYTWNVAAALSGAAACLFIREFADLRRFSPRVYAVFGWLAAAFVLLTLSNLLKLIGFDDLVNNFGNALFLGSAVFTLIVAFIAWRRDSRAAGWFLIAWGLLEAFTIATAIRLLLNSGDEHDRLLNYGLPLSMVAAAVLIALGIADRLREQRVALTEAERHAQIDSLTGVLNRRSVIERLDAACQRARARGLPISLLFIDLDHFKEINDSFGHAAGDACLAAIIHPIQAELRQSDVIGRYGGEEFVVILSSADAAAANPIAQRILERVAGVRVAGFGEPIGLTCSIGVASSDTLGVWGENLIARADAAVYAAKRSGRNRVQFARPLAA